MSGKEGCSRGTEPEEQEGGAGGGRGSGREQEGGAGGRSRREGRIRQEDE
jgi:hypothetical protein